MNDRTPTLPKTAPARVWIEDTKTAAHGHGGPGWEFGSCLWSPSSAEGGTDRYSIMRELSADDLVIHLNDGDIVGWSRVAAPFQEVKEAPPNPGEWAGRPSYYRIPLRDYLQFPRVTPVAEFLLRNHIALLEELQTEAPKRYPFILYNDTVRRAQGAYLTRCTTKLYDLVRHEVYLDEEPEPYDPVTRTWRQRPGVEERVRQKLQLATRSEQVLRACAELLAWAIEVADGDRPDAWYLRETDHGLRLMTGRLRACELRRSRLRISVIGPVSDDVLGALGARNRGRLQMGTRRSDRRHAAGQSRRCSLAAQGCDGRLHRWCDDTGAAISQLGRPYPRGNTLLVSCARTRVAAT